MLIIYFRPTCYCRHCHPTIPAEEVMKPATLLYRDREDRYRQFRLVMIHPMALKGQNNLAYLFERRSRSTTWTFERNDGFVGYIAITVHLRRLFVIDALFSFRTKETWSSCWRLRRGETGVVVIFMFIFVSMIMIVFSAIASIRIGRLLLFFSGHLGAFDSTWYQSKTKEQGWRFQWSSQRLLDSWSRKWLLAVRWTTFLPWWDRKERKNKGEKKKKNNNMSTRNNHWRRGVTLRGTISLCALCEVECNRLPSSFSLFCLLASSLHNIFAVWWSVSFLYWSPWKDSNCVFVVGCLRVRDA